MGVRLDTSQVLAVAADLDAAAGKVGPLVYSAVAKTAYDIQGDAQVLAPVDTGALMGSISTSVSGSPAAGRVQAEVGPTVAYGLYVEMGTSRMAAQPYLAPAFDRRIGGLSDALTQAGSGIF